MIFKIHLLLGLCLFVKFDMFTEASRSKNSTKNFNEITDEVKNLNEIMDEVKNFDGIMDGGTTTEKPFYYYVSPLKINAEALKISLLFLLKITSVLFHTSLNDSNRRIGFGRPWPDFRSQSPIANRRLILARLCLA